MTRILVQNFYDKDDVLAFPLKGVNEAYRKAVTKDIAVNVGGLLTSWNPLSHLNYDSDNEVITPIVDGLVRTWKAINLNESCTGRKKLNIKK